MKIKCKNHSDSAQRRGKTASCQIMLCTKEEKSGAQHGKQKISYCLRWDHGVTLRALKLEIQQKRLWKCEKKEEILRHGFIQ